MVGLTESGGAVTQSYAAGVVAGASNIGGLIGQNLGAVTQSYAVGRVSGAHNVGGLLGANSGAVTTSYWDTIATGQTNGVGFDTGSFAGVGLTTAQLKAGLPAGFDPAVWGVTPGVTYPFLKSVQP